MTIGILSAAVVCCLLWSSRRVVPDSGHSGGDSELQEFHRKAQRSPLFLALTQHENIRDHVIVENQHQPTTMNMRTFINNRYKLTVHFNQDYGELYDLEENPGEYENLWDKPECQELKQNLLLKFIHGEMAKAPLLMPRIAGA
jgi:hypothetical protein